MLGANLSLRDAFIELVSGDGEPPLMASAVALSRLLQRDDTWSGATDRLNALELMVEADCRDLPMSHAAGAVVERIRAEGFTGNREHYEHIDNSFVDRVLERGRGLPITLSILTLHLAEHVGVALTGIAFPGHFLVGRDLDDSAPEIFDPFADGQRLGFAELAELYSRTTGQPMTAQAPLLRQSLRPAGPRAILSRMLRNLQHHYALRGSHDRMAEVLGLLAILHPELEKLRTLQGHVQRRLASLN